MTPTRLPTGTVSFLFTDIEGSTRLWEMAPVAMRSALARHDELARAAIERHAGTVFKTVGDAFCAAFFRADDALEAAIDVQRALAEEAWPEAVGRMRVRIGIHTGTAAETGGDYFGPTVNRVARLMSIGYGEQILVSGASAALLRDALPDGVALRDLGTHRLKDLAEPERTYQVLAPGLRADFPALRSIDSRPNNIPLQISSFVGRDDELAELREALAARRLVTIAGPGGIGKTRVALQAAADAIDRFADGAWIVELAHLRSGDLIAQTVADVLRIREQAQSSLDQTIASELSDRELLIVLDSAEHLVSPVASFVKTVLSRCAGVKVLVTSREPLHLTGEYVFRLGALQHCAELLLDRAREVVAGFVADQIALDAVEGICARLECIPLAIELAAARAATIPLAEISARLERGLGVLVSRDPTREARHRTLHATIAWSFGLLEEDEARVLRSLAVFSGTFDAAAVEAVTGDPNAQDMLETLADKSLVAIATGTATRYIVPDAVREYIVEELRREGAFDAVAERHCAYFMAWAARQPIRAAGAEVGARLDLFASEMGNLRAALEWAMEHRPLDAAAMMIHLSAYWKIRGHFSEGRRWMRRALACDEITGPTRASLLRRAATLATEQDDYEEAHALTLDALALYEAAADPGGVGEALHNLAVVEQRRGRLDEAGAHYGAAIERFREAGHDYGESIALVNMALLAFGRDDLEAAERLIEAAAAAASRSGNADVRGHVEGQRANLARRRGRYDEAIRHYVEATALKRAVGNRYDLADLHDGLATVYVRLGRFDEAVAASRETLRTALDLDATSLAIFAFEGFSEIALEERRFEDAARWFLIARELRRAHSYEPSARRLDEIERTIARENAARYAEIEREVSGVDWRAAAKQLLEA